jgi:hypothetical protein
MHHCHRPLHLVWYFEPASFPEDIYSWDQVVISNTAALWWLRCIVTSRSLWVSSFESRPVHVGFVVDKWHLDMCFLQVHQYSQVVLIPPMLRTHLFNCHQHFVTPETGCVVKQHTTNKCHNQRLYLHPKAATSVSSWHYLLFQSV